MLHIDRLAWTEWPAVEPVWSSLVRHSAPDSIFLSTDWVSTWCEVYGRHLQPNILLFSAGHGPIGCCLLVEGTERRRFVPVRVLYLNTAGERPGDSVCVEYNTLLCVPERAAEVARALSEHVSGVGWDELSFDGMLVEDAAAVLEAFGSLPHRREVKPSPYVDLDRIRASGADYLSTLSSNTRGQIRRSMRRYEELGGGPLRIDAAASVDEAHAYLDELMHLHDARWKARREAGAFATDRSREFHRQLIARRLAHGGVELLRVTAGSIVVGLLYNFIEANKVCYYQSGFEYRPDPRLKPGMVTHALAIGRALEAGRREYDLLAGDYRYKRSLATDARDLVWIRLERGNLKTRAIALLRTVRRFVQAARTSRPHFFSLAGWMPILLGA